MNNQWMPLWLVALTGLACLPGVAWGEEAEAEVDLYNYPIAILPFNERGGDVEGLGSQVADLLFAGLVVEPDVLLVDREDLNKTLDEAELNLTGLVRQDEAIEIGHMTGAKLIVTGSVMQIDNKLHIVAKIIGTETTRVRGAAVKGEAGSETDTLVEELAKQIASAMREHADTLVAKRETKDDRLAKVKAEVADKKLPSVSIQVAERHVGRPTIDPAAQTELALFFTEAGFEVIDADHGGQKKADLLIEGEGMSEFASRRGNLTSVKARVEVKAVDAKTGRVIAIDRQTRVGVDNLELIAGKTALQNAAADIAERLIPKVAEAK